jgi:cytochrome P450
MSKNTDTLLLNEKLNPFPLYSNMRKNCPVQYDDKADLWNIYRYEDVRRILTDYVNFSSDFTKASGAQLEDAPFRRSLISSDPPLHRYLRSTISSAFSAASIEQLEPRIRGIANEMIDSVIENGSMDLVRDFSYPLPVTVIAELLGIPIEDRGLFKSWADELIKAIDESAVTGARRNVKLERMQEEMDSYFKKVIIDKKENPGQDLITQLIKAETDNRKLSEEDVLSFCSLLLQAGHITTVNLITNCILSLIQYPDQLAKIKRDSFHLKSAIEETLRYRSPVQVLLRIATKDVVLAGKTVKAGQRVIPCLGSANRDEHVFMDPEVFDIMRDPNPHVAFGAGIHLCLGAPLARLESHVAIDALLNRLQNLELGDDARNLEPVSNSLLFYGVKSLPLLYDTQ